MNRSSARLNQFDLDRLKAEARRLVICTGCYGSGEDRWNEGRACPACEGSGKSAAEPHVLELVAEVERLRALAGERDE